MKNKKYYFLINSLEGGGAERVTINFANNLFKKNYDVYIITLKSTNFYDLPIGIKHIGLSNIKNNLLMFLLIPLFVYKFRKLIKKLDIKEGMSLLEIANFVHILSKKNAIISFRIHLNFFKGFLGFLYKLLIKILYPKAGKIIVNSLENKYDLAEFLKISNKKIDVIYNPIDKEKIKILKEEPLENEILEKIRNKKVFITTGRLVWQKHHEKILYALASLPNKDWIYLIVGDGPERKKLENISKTLGLTKNILFLGEQKNVFKFLNIANIFLYASEVEGFPNVLLEAREMGLPIITSDFKSGAKEVILGKYTKNIGKNITYPYQGKYGVLLDLNSYEEQLIKTYTNM